MVKIISDDEMTTPPPPAGSLGARFGDAGHALSNATIAFHEAVAERLGLHITDHKALRVLWQRGPLPAGRLAEELGLSSGALTALVDRLERAGYVTRARDAADRRRVLVRPVRSSAREAEVMRLFEPMERAIGSTLRKYSDAERRLILDFIESAVAALQEATRELRRTPGPGPETVGGQPPGET
jgi:DNA-binding MarR family transcriptional regulator